MIAIHLSDIQFAEGAALPLCKQQVATIWDTFSLFVGGDSPEQIARKFTKFNVTKPAGIDSWSGKSVRAILYDRRYVELCEFCTLSSMCGRQSIIEPSAFEYVQRRLAELEQVA